MNRQLEQFLDNPPDLGFLRRLFDALYVRRRLLRESSITVYNRERLPGAGPAIFVANHESLVDAVLIQFCYPPSMLASVRPTGSREHFKKKGPLPYFMAGSMMRICFIDQGSGEAAKAGLADPLAALHAPLEAGAMLIYFPQGTRGSRAEEVPFLPGIFHLAKAHPGVPIIPVLLRGTERLHPKGVPFWKFFSEHPVRLYVGEAWQFDFSDTPQANVARLEQYVFGLETQV